MRFIGNKESITDEILGLLEQKGLLNKNLTLLDAFCGTGSVANALKGSFDIIINDLLNWCVVYTKGIISAIDCKFDKLGLDPFEFFNTSAKTLQGFIYNNYAPTNSERMYFTPENAGRIDYFRQQIEEWNNQQLLSEEEYAYLLACLIESVSSVSNTAGVYGAFLKKWDPRAIKPIVFNKIDSNIESHNLVSTYNGKIEEIITNIQCDVLYLDPPYTQNQYGTQYHLLETLILDDNPSISPITGSRSTTNMRSDWSKKFKANIKFDYVIANTQAKYILFSYNNDGFMSKEYIEACLKRYGKQETYLCKKIPYKKYRNFKTKGDKKHFEYLFFVEKREEKDVCYESPLNYIGSKSKMITDIKRNLPNDIQEFYDLFGGGFNIGINIVGSHVIYNDINSFVKELVISFREYDTYNYLLYIRQITKKFGLEKANANNYVKARDYYNSLPMDKRDPRLLYTIILYGFQQQIRFNGGHNFNNPVGMRWFNDKVLEKMISFSRVIKTGNYTFICKDFSEILEEIKPNAFVYMDPPYRLTTGSYNDGKRGFSGWTIDHEKKLLELADNLNKAGIRFMISYVVEHGGKMNMHISNWIEERGYYLITVDEIPGRKRKEVLIINYEQ